MSSLDNPQPQLPEDSPRAPETPVPLLEEDFGPSPKQAREARERLEFEEIAAKVQEINDRVEELRKERDDRVEELSKERDDRQNAGIQGPGLNDDTFENRMEALSDIYKSQKTELDLIRDQMLHSIKELDRILGLKINFDDLTYWNLRPGENPETILIDLRREHNDPPYNDMIPVDIEIAIMPDRSYQEHSTYFISPTGRYHSFYDSRTNLSEDFDTVYVDTDLDRDEPSLSQRLSRFHDDFR